MPDNSLIGFAQYVESLCASHVEIKHSAAEPHYIELTDENQIQTSKNQIYPLVALDKLTIQYHGQNDGMTKSRVVDLLFLDKAASGDYVAIQAIKNRMERIAEEFVVKMKIDSRNRTVYGFLRNLVFDSIEINTIENKGINLHGAMLSLSYNLPFIEFVESGRFV